MTYFELIISAYRKIYANEITLGEYKKMVTPLNREIEPEKKTGKWEYVQYDGNPNIGNWHCSECRRIVFLLHSQKQNEKPLYDFCPWCGAKMEVDG